MLAIAVGMPVTRHPPHRSVRAQLRHTAPTLSSDGEPVFRPRMLHVWGWEPFGGEPFHFRPRDAGLLTATFQRATPEQEDTQVRRLCAPNSAGSGVVAQRIADPVQLRLALLLRGQADLDHRQSLVISCRPHHAHPAARRPGFSRCPRKLPRQVDNSELETSWLKTLGRNSAGGMLPRESCGRYSL